MFAWQEFHAGPASAARSSPDGDARVFPEATPESLLMGSNAAILNARVPRRRHQPREFLRHLNRATRVSPTIGFSPLPYLGETRR